MIVNLWISWMSILAKKTKTPLKTQKTTWRILNIKMSIRVGPVFTFSLPEGRIAPLAPVSYATCNNTTMLPCYARDNCYLFIYAAPGATLRNWNEKSKSSSDVTSAKGGETRFHTKKGVGTPFPPRCTRTKL